MPRLPRKTALQEALTKLYHAHDALSGHPEADAVWEMVQRIRNANPNDEAGVAPPAEELTPQPLPPQQYAREQGESFWSEPATH